MRVGTAGWSIPASSAALFASSGSHLERYARTLNCAEINSSFYRPHRASTWERWAAVVPDDFRFAVKMSKSITHEAKLDCSRAMLALFVEQAKLLGPKLGPLLVQLPPSLAFEPARAEQFFLTLRDCFDGWVALEPRHASWFEGDADPLLLRHQIARVAADPARIPAAAVPGGWPGLAYYRLHGSPRTYYSAYTEGYLKHLQSRLAAVAHHAEAWCIFDNTAMGEAAHNALALQALNATPAR